MNEEGPCWAWEFEIQTVCLLLWMPKASAAAEAALAPALPTPSKRSASMLSRLLADSSSLVELIARVHALAPYRARAPRILARARTRADVRRARARLLAFVALLAQTPADDLTETLQATGSREMQQLWASLAPRIDVLLEAVVASCGDDGAAGADGPTARAIGELEAVVALVRCTIGAEGVTIAPQLVHVGAALHDVIFELDGDEAAGLQDAIVCMCEEWWRGERPAREGLVPQAIAYVLVRALGADATNADVRRACALRGALGAIDFEVGASASLKKLLLHALICPRFLRHVDGRRFLVGLFALSDRLVAELHAAIKNQLPVCRPSLRLQYSHLYARAWRAAAGGPSAGAIERAVQELMVGAVHARTSAMASALRAALSEVHALQGTSAAADAMLARLYAPVLWRALKAPNPLVRRNAAALFFDVFPLAPLPSVVPPAATPRAPPLARAEVDGNAEKQWALVVQLLRDDAQAVRALAAHGAARALALHGGGAPVGVPKALITRLAAELAHDASSAAVRHAALDALRFLLESAVAPAAPAGGGGSDAPRGSPCDTSHVSLALREALPAVGSLAHDSCERVRSTLFALLLAMRRVRSPAWTAVAPADALARRLPLERPALRAQLCALLLPHYLPPTAGAASASGGAGFGKLLPLLRAHPAAACTLLAQPPTGGKGGAAVRARLAASLVELLARHLSEPTAPTDEPTDDDDGARCSALVAPLAALAALLDAEAVATARTPAAGAAGGGAPGAPPQKVRAQLDTSLTPSLADALWARSQGSALACDTLRRIAARLPEGAMPAVSSAVAADCAAVLAVMPTDALSRHATRADARADGAEASVRGASRFAEGSNEGVLACVCAWDRSGALLEAIGDALAAPQAGDAHGQPEAAASVGARAGKRGRAVPAAPAAPARERLAAAGHACGLLLECLDSARLRAELLSAPRHRAAL